MCQQTYPAPEACVVVLEDPLSRDMAQAPNWVARSYFLTMRNIAAWALPQATSQLKEQLPILFAEKAAVILPDPTLPTQTPDSLESIIQTTHEWPRLSQQLGAYCALFLFLRHVRLSPDELSVYLQQATAYAPNQYSADFHRPDLRPWIKQYFSLRKQLVDELDRRRHACGHCAAACA